MYRMNSLFDTLLESRGWILADGATGTNLFDMGLGPGDPPELWNLSQPDKIAALYEASIKAGSDVFLTNSFGSNRLRLKLHDASHQCHELNRRAAAIGREVVERSNSPALIAGAMGPTGEIMAPLGTLTYEMAVEVFHEQADGLKEGGVDLLWIETLSSQEEFLAAQESSSRVGLPWCGTMSFDTVGRTMMGVTPKNLADIVHSLDTPPIGFGINCGSGASDSILTLMAIVKENPSIPIIVKGNAGIPQFVDGKVHYCGSPTIMAHYAQLARNCGAQIIGGCCGTTAAHLVAMRKQLEGGTKGSVPTLQEIIECTGKPNFDPLAQPKERQRQARRRKR